MKRWISSAAIASLLMGDSLAYGASTSTAQQPKWKDAYKKYIANYLKSEDLMIGDCVITLVDIDRDGVPELFGGLSYRTENVIDIAYTYKNGKVQKLTQKGPGAGDSGSIGFNLGMTAFVKGHILVYKEKKTGKYVVIGKDSGGGAVSVSGGDYSLTLNGTVLTTKEINGFYEEQTEGGNWEGIYYSSGKKVSKKQYDASRSNYYAQLTALTKQSSTIAGSSNANSFSDPDLRYDMTDSEINEAIYKLYQSYSPSK
ncbi:hypothetical protein PCCS19_35260 [Paenibacillus sp. CCS19]|uniref:hypothetical protein n=1 Tax=Paenibacillus sp. CCS19 TaxID=3158387 RepID=UPI0025614948|nr:hypothetical protein [Paenibacillus cellulosilyticus]GMK40470.1 hypothetical protein PCCS19_35260 [Paenibacillus cellulosilyticus]